MLTYTVAILAQGAHWADALQQVLFEFLVAALSCFVLFEVFPVLLVVASVVLWVFNLFVYMFY